MTPSGQALTMHLIIEALQRYIDSGTPNEASLASFALGLVKAGADDPEVNIYLDRWADKALS